MKASRESALSTIILTGLSGAGKSVVLNTLEDTGYFCVDNIPTSMIKTFVHLSNRTPAISKVAIGVDIRERKFFSDLMRTLSSLKKKQKLEIVFLEAMDDVIMRRFKETRRPHPLGLKDLKRAIDREMKLLSDIRDVADRIIDTSSLNPHQLRTMIMRLYSGGKEKTMSVSLLSFGYKYGIPAEADLLFDVRFLPNPNFIEKLRPYDGTTKRVKDFIIRKKDTVHFLQKLYSLLHFLIPHYLEDGRSYLTIGIGCTGGRHRSPAVVEEIQKNLKKQKYNVSVIHRDIHEFRR
jgi:UPF0042 nucleotide-binding protein